MSNEDKAVIRMDEEIVNGVVKRLKGTLTRMNKLRTPADNKKGGVAHDLLVKSFTRMSEALKLFEDHAVAKAIRQKPATRNIVAFIANCINMLDSLNDGFDENEVTKEEIARIAGLSRSALNQAITEIETLVKFTGHTEMDAADKLIAEAAAKPKPETTKDTKGGKYVYQKDRDARETVEDERKALQRAARDIENHAVMKRVIEKESIHLSKLPSSKTSKEEFKIMKLPVVPLFTKVVTADMLKKAGFEVGNTLGFYNILQNQLLVAVNTAVLFSEKEGKDGNPKRVQSVKLGTYIEQIVQLISQKKGRVYHVVGNEESDAGRKHNRSPGFVYFWILPDSDINAMNRMGGSGGSIKIETWGLGF